jgi:hypothetical protein
MQDSRFKSFTESVDIIGKLGRQLASLQADVIAIEGLRVDENGDAEALVKVSDSDSLNIGLRLPPSAMLTVKRQEILRAMNALKAEFNEILDHAETLSERCKPSPVTQVASAPLNVDADVLERMTRDLKEEIEGATQHGPDGADRETTHPSSLRPRIGPPPLRDTLFNRRPRIAAAE